MGIDSQPHTKVVIGVYVVPQVVVDQILECPNPNCRRNVTVDTSRKRAQCANCKQWSEVERAEGSVVLRLSPDQNENLATTPSGNNETSFPWFWVVVIGAAIWFMTPCDKELSR